MFRNYLTIAIRNLVKYRVYSLINISGLAVAISFCILALLFARDEWTYDTFHQHADEIYRVYRIKHGIQSPETPGPLPELLATLPEVTHAVRASWGSGVVQCGNKAFTENGLFASPEIFSVFSFPLLSGDPTTALNSPDAIVLSARAARKYFGEEDPMGERLSVLHRQGNHEFVVTGIAQNAPDNSTIRFDFVLPVAMLGERVHRWDASFWATYVRLAPGTSVADLTTRLPAHIPGNVRKDTKFYFQPLEDIHLNTSISGTASAPLYSYILGGIAVLILLIGCINFANLSIGLSATRAREVGVRKASGAVRAQLMGQFWVEAVALSFVALLAGVVLADLFLPAFNSLARKELVLDYGGPSLLALVGLTLVVGLVAGSYPALVLSRIQPAAVLKGDLKTRGIGWSRRILVVVQFTLSIGLIIMTMSMDRQLAFLQTKNLGFDREQIVIIPTHLNGRETAAESYETVDVFRNALAPYGKVISVAGAYAHTGLGIHNTLRFKDAGIQVPASMTDAGMLESTGLKFFEVPFAMADHNYLKTLDIELAEGRDFSPERTGDIQGSVLVNQAFARRFGLEDPVGTQFVISRNDVTIIGVVEDFHFRSLHHKIEPLIVQPVQAEGSPIRFVMVKIGPDDVSSTLDLLQEKWRSAAPELPFQFSFLDEEIERQYRAEDRWGKIIATASLFAILLSCMGIFGLTALAVSRRTKEIGIRKVLGATVGDVVLLLANEFTWLVVVANVVAWPIAYFSIGSWLEGFAHRVEIGAWVFVAGGVLVLATTLLTVSYQTVKAALANPVDSLQYE